MICFWSLPAKARLLKFVFAIQDMGIAMTCSGREIGFGVHNRVKVRPLRPSSVAKRAVRCMWACVQIQLNPYIKEVSKIGSLLCQIKIWPFMQSTVAQEFQTLKAPQECLE